MNNFILHKANSRGHSNHGWLESYHTFSFASYYNPERIQFGALRVLNDDIVQGGMGFGTHPHDNMEIISIPLSGDLEHKDSMGNLQVVREGEIQVMSAGTGIQHSEYNRNQDKPVNFLQIWIFPNKRGVVPRYDQIAMNPSKMQNKFAQILSPSAEDEGVWIHQDAWFHRGKFSGGQTEPYLLKKKDNGLYVFILEGSAEVMGHSLEKRDGLGITGLEEISFKFHCDSDILLMEVPMSN
jgi:redox-sensitive bicupin YhaK (pirin superfamily)